jgi:hypothetical protein
VKSRGEQLEIKVPLSDKEATAYDGIFAGRVELWAKWSIANADSTSWLSTVPVDKERDAIVFAVNGDTAAAKPPHEHPPEGCLVEITRLSVIGRRWWTLGFEAFGDPGKVKRHLGVVRLAVLSQPGGVPQLPTEGMFASYPGWLEAIGCDNAMDTGDFLLAEFEHLSSSLISSEESGDSRANIFLAIAGGTCAAIGLTESTRLQSTTPGSLVPIVVLPALIVLGCMTLSRLIQRNLMSTKYIVGLSRLRGLMLQREPWLHDLLMFPPEKVEHRKISWPADLLPWRRGGVVEMVSVVNALLAGGTAALLVLRRNGTSPDLSAILAAGAVVTAAWLLQRVWVWRRYKKGADYAILANKDPAK